MSAGISRREQIELLESQWDTCEKERRLVGDKLDTADEIWNDCGNEECAEYWEGVVAVLEERYKAIKQSQYSVEDMLIGLNAPGWTSH